MRVYVIAAAAILLFAAAAVAIIVVLPGSGGPRRPAPSEPAPPSLVVPAAPVAPLSEPPPPVASLARPPAPPPVAAPVIQRPPPPPKDSWEAVKPVARLAALGPLGAAISRELAELQPRLSACFDEVTQARYGTKRFTETKDYAPLDDYGSAVLMLEVQTGQDEARIVDAPVETRGGASDGLLACTQAILRGRAVPVPGVAAGVRTRVLYTLQQ